MADAGKQALDPVFSSIGDAGKYQIIILLLISASKFPVGWQQLSSVFLAPQVDKHCNVPDNTTDICSPECTEVWYDRSVFKQTITMEWDLICDKKNWDKYGQTIFMFGILLGNIIFGIWADKKGRRPPLVWSIVLQLVSGCLAAIAPWYWLFVFLRFLCALATGGNMLTTFCLIMEIIGPSRREFLTGIIYQIPFNIGHLTLPLFAYFTKHFRWYQFSFSIYSVLLLSYFFTIPESPRWLVLSGQTDRAVKILENAAEFNGQPTERIRQNCEDAVRARAAQGPVKKGNLFDLLRTPNLRKYSLCIFYNWFAVGFNYFGVSQYIGSLGGNIFVNITISGLFSVPGVILSVPACKYLGRKPTLIIADFAIGLSMLLFLFVPDSMNTAKVVLSSVAVFGGALLFPTCYLVAAEIFPTQARNSGMGIASMLARIGAMIAANAGILEELIKWMPPLVFSLIAFVAMFLAFFLPETFGHSLPETCEDAENYEKTS